MIAIIDYGMGNLRSVQKGFEFVGFDAVVTSDPGVVLKAQGVVLPGVGAFPDAISCLVASGMDMVVKRVIADDKPFLGICLGLQLLFSESTETFDGSPAIKGLGIVPGRVVKFEGDLKIPQIGWNVAVKTRNEGLMAGIPDKAYFYFVHSYYVIPDDPSVVATRTDYGVDFTSSISKGNLFATQFHPEKSSKWGLEIFRNFGRLAEKSGDGSN